MKYDTDIWNSQKYLIEATIPEMSICTDCILSRLTIINVEPADLGHYYINATSPDFPPEYGKITLYRKRFFREEKNKYIYNIFRLETPDCQQFITHRDNKGCKRIYTHLSSSNIIIPQFSTIFFIVFLNQILSYSCQI